MTSVAPPAGLASIIRPLSGTAFDHDAILDLVGDAKVVLIGESTHGTQEFYRERAALTRRLILQKGFTGVAVEADWPDAYRVNTYVRGQSSASNAERAETHALTPLETTALWDTGEPPETFPTGE